jgi:hypothetical protein
MAEVVRGGLQGVPSGQEEAADSLGLHWWHVQAFVVLPQALCIVVPGIINTVVDLFKDITLVTIIGLFDLLGTVEQALKEPAWLGFATEAMCFPPWCSSSAAPRCPLTAVAWNAGLQRANNRESATDQQRPTPPVLASGLPWRNTTVGTSVLKDRNPPAADI